MAVKSTVDWALKFFTPSTTKTSTSIDPSDYVKILGAIASIVGTGYATVKASGGIAASAAPTMVDRARGVDDLHSAAKYLSDDSPDKKKEVYDMKTYLQLVFIGIIVLTLKLFYLNGAKITRKANKSKKTGEKEYGDIDFYKGDDEHKLWYAYLLSYYQSLRIDPNFWLLMPTRTIQHIIMGASNSVLDSIGVQDKAKGDIIFSIMQFVFFVDFTIFCLGLGGWTITATTVANLAVLFGYKIHETHHPEAVSVEQKAQADSIFRGLPASGQRIVSWLTASSPTPKRK